MVTISTLTIVKDEELFLPMMISCAQQFVDEIVIVVDDSTTDKTIEVIKSFKDKRIKYFTLPDFTKDFGRARKFAHDHCTSDWIFCLDADEVIHEFDVKNIKPALEKLEKMDCDVIHAEYIHFIENFSKIDNSMPLHVGIFRLYKNYPEVTFKRKNHALPEYNFKKILLTDVFRIWHMGYLRGMSKIRERFMRNYGYSEMHMPLQQVRWRDWHYFGTYPTKPIDINLIPKVIRDHFYMEEGQGSLLK